MPGFVDIMGIALAYKPVTVNGQVAYHKGEYFRRELSVSNNTSAVRQQVIVQAEGEPTVTGYLFVPRTPEQFTYDLDGNLTADGRWSYTWDAENRLVRVESRSNTPQASWRRVEWTYDAKGRRIGQKTSLWGNSTWIVVEDLKFISDPMSVGRHIAELNATNPACAGHWCSSYVWGLDLSGALDGAGGVGGLLWVRQHSGSAAGVHYCAYDENGNVVALSAASNGSESARYEYGPFGEPIRITGAAARSNPFRFSTKRTDNTTDLVLYEYRAYSPSLGRWLSIDPIGVRGGVNLLSLGANNSSECVDALGLSCASTLSFMTNKPVFIKSEKEIKRLCNDSPACSGPNRKPKLSCKKCGPCGWKLVVTGRIKCLIYLADPNSVRVIYEPNLEAVVIHEKCHCGDWASVLEQLVKEANATEYGTKQACEEAKRAFWDRVMGLIEPSLNHKLQKYQIGGECYAAGEFVK